jgi:hypothetical protein
MNNVHLELYQKLKGEIKKLKIYDVMKKMLVSEGDLEISVYLEIIFLLAIQLNGDNFFKNIKNNDLKDQFVDLLCIEKNDDSVLYNEIVSINKKLNLICSRNFCHCVC